MFMRVLQARDGRISTLGTRLRNWVALDQVAIFVDAEDGVWPLMTEQIDRGVSMRLVPVFEDDCVAQCARAVAATAMAVVFLHGNPVRAQSRGELLYDMNCVACHSEKMHWRSGKLVNDWTGLEVQVRRWQQAASLGWNDEDILEVARYLNERFYGFAPRNPTGSMEVPAPAPAAAGPTRVARP